MKKAEQPISTLAVAGLGLFALAIFGALGGLLYKARTRNLPPPIVLAQAPSKSLPKSSAAKDDGDAVSFRIVSRVPAKEDSVESATPAAESNPLENTKPQAAENSAPVEVASNEPGLKVFTPTEISATAPKTEMSDDLIGEIKGQSYTTKKMLSNGLDPNNPAKPDNKPPAKKPEVKKPVVPTKTPVVPPPPVQPPKPVTAKPDAPKQPAALPSLPATGDGKIDVTKAPIYVLNDGRRLRALIVREADGMVSIRNEVGTQITFKKSDVKEVVRN